MGYSATFEKHIDRLARTSQIIMTTTPSTRPLIQDEWINPGSTLIAIGADSPHKQELSAQLLQRADRVVSDCPKQAQQRGEIFHAISKGYLNMETVESLGSILKTEHNGRKQDKDIIVVDLTGVAVQDLAIAQAVYKKIGAGQ